MRSSPGLLLAALLVAGCLTDTGQPAGTAATTAEPGSSVRVTSNSASTSETLSLGDVRGIVTDDELRPIAGAAIRILELDVKASSSPDGKFSFLDVPEGRYSLEAQAASKVGQVKVVRVPAGQTMEIDFQLAAIPVHEPRIELIQHVTIIHTSGGPVVSQLGQVVPIMCSDNCSWSTILRERPDQLLVEVSGRHSVSHAKGWDGLRINVFGHPLNSTNYQNLYNCHGGLTNDPLAECLRLPLRVPLSGGVLAAEKNTRLGELSRLRVTYWCEDTWACIEDRYETYLSLFHDWEDGEIPSGYTALPDGTG